MNDFSIFGLPDLNGLNGVNESDNYIEAYIRCDKTTNRMKIDANFAAL